MRILRTSKRIYQLVQDVISGYPCLKYIQIPNVINIPSCHDKILRIRMTLYGNHVWCKNLFTAPFKGSYLHEMKNINEAVMTRIVPCLKKRQSIGKIKIEVYETNANFLDISKIHWCGKLTSLKKKKSNCIEGKLMSEIYWKIGESITYI